ncbi:MAG: gamma-glutamyl-gamma-aminobutyrate hydrolase family protein, partial [Bacteroidaceae bacterium]|nr:gamma-glutamyl-gamma-aminobutyrate hydrolase family protein [Bacteroidaceae bacterium]
MKRTIFLCLLAALTLTGSARRSLRVGVAEVGNSGAVQAPRVYINALTMAGHTAIVIPDIDDPQRLRKILEDVDALVLPGGEDVEPARYGAQPSPRLGTVNPRRDDFEFRLLTEATRMKKPILGICRGMQMI